MRIKPINDIYYQDIDTLNLFCVDSLKFRTEINYPLNSSTGRLKWYIDGIEKTNVRDSESWTLTEEDFPDIYNSHTYTLIITDVMGDVDTLETTFGIAGAQELPLTVTPPSTEFYVTLQSSVSTDFIEEVKSKGFEYRKQGDATWIPLEADADFNATTPNLNDGKWEFRAVLETFTDCGTLYSEVEGLVIVCNCD